MLPLIFQVQLPNTVQQVFKVKQNLILALLGEGRLLTWKEKAVCTSIVYYLAAPTFKAEPTSEVFGGIQSSHFTITYILTSCSHKAENVVYSDGQPHKDGEIVIAAHFTQPQLCI